MRTDGTSSSKTEWAKVGNQGQKIFLIIPCDKCKDIQGSKYLALNRTLARRDARQSLVILRNWLYVGIAVRKPPLDKYLVSDPNPCHRESGSAASRLEIKSGIGKGIPYINKSSINSCFGRKIISRK